MNRANGQRKPVLPCSHRGWLACCIALLAAASANAADIPARAAVVGYLPDYHVEALSNAQTRQLDRVDWPSLTQINYFSFKPDAATAELPKKTTSGGSMEQLDRVVAQAHAHGVRVSVVIGGAGLDKTLRKIADDPALHMPFAKILQAFAEEHQLDGVDLDLETQHPSAEQVANYGRLIQSLRQNTRGLTLSAAVSATKLEITPTKNSHDEAPEQWPLTLEAVADLDQIGVMAYDFDFADHAPLQLSEKAMRDWARYVGPANAGKLLFGVPFYARAGTGWGRDEKGNRLNDEANYAEMADLFAAKNHTSIPEDVSHFDAAFADKLQGASNTWHFNGLADIRAKTQFALDQHYGGVMIWDLGQDHVAGTDAGERNVDVQSLLGAIGRTMRKNGALNEPLPPIVPTSRPSSPSR